MARRRKNRTVKQLAMVGGALLLLQLGYTFFSPREKPLAIKEAISSRVARENLGPLQAEQLRIQLSVLDYQQETGKLPEKLELLVPKYFDAVPTVPGSNEVFRYVVKDGRYYIGEEAKLQISSGKQSKSTDQGIIVNLDSDTPLPPNVQKALIDSLSNDPALQSAAFVYDPTGKRDPFQPFDFAPKTNEDPNKTPLERYDVAQLKLTAILGGLGDESSATVENAAGKGFIVKKGTKIGLNSGEVVDIQSDKIVIVESSVDFTGLKKTKTIELRLRTKAQDEALINRR